MVLGVVHRVRAPHLLPGAPGEGREAKDKYGDKGPALRVHLILLFVLLEGLYDVAGLKTGPGAHLGLGDTLPRVLGYGQLADLFLALADDASGLRVHEVLPWSIDRKDGARVEPAPGPGPDDHRGAVYGEDSAGKGLRVELLDHAGHGLGKRVTESALPQAHVGRGLGPETKEPSG